MLPPSGYTASLLRHAPETASSASGANGDKGPAHRSHQRRQPEPSPMSWLVRGFSLCGRLCRGWEPIDPNNVDLPSAPSPLVRNPHEAPKLASVAMLPARQGLRSKPTAVSKSRGAPLYKTDAPSVASRAKAKESSRQAPHPKIKSVYNIHDLLPVPAKAGKPRTTKTTEPKPRTTKQGGNERPSTADSTQRSATTQTSFIARLDRQVRVAEALATTQDQSSVQAVLFDNDAYNSIPFARSVKFIGVPGKKIEVQLKFVQHDRQGGAQKIYAVPKTALSKTASGRSDDARGDALGMSPASIQILGRTKFLQHLAKHGELYDANAGINSKTVEAFNPDAFPNLRAAFFDWDGTLSKMEQVHGGGSSFSDWFAELTAGFVNPPAKYEFIWAVAEYYFGGLARIELLRGLFKSLFDRKITVFILTRNRAVDDIFATLAGLLVPPEHEEYFKIQRPQSLDLPWILKRDKGRSFSALHVLHSDFKMQTIVGVLRQHLSLPPVDLSKPEWSNMEIEIRYRWSTTEPAFVQPVPGPPSTSYPG